MPKKKKATPTSSYIIAILVVIILILLGLLYLNRSNVNSSSSTQPNNSTSSTPTSSSTQPNNGHSFNTNNGVSQGGVIPDTSVSSGTTTTTILIPPQSDWQYSTNNSIVLQYPTQNATLVTGQPIIGLAAITPVDFLLIDNSVGKIASGTLKVVNGKFDSSIEFTPHSTSGVLQIYHPNPYNGAEQDIINININFQ